MTKLNIRMNYREATIYWIHLTTHTDIESEGFIGVSTNYLKRYKVHRNASIKNTHTNQQLATAFNTHTDIVVDVFMMGTKSFCHQIEAKLRPTPNIGWNVAPGGKVGPGWAKGKNIVGGRRSIAHQPNRPFCKLCKSALAKANGVTKNKFKKWHKYCSGCAKAAYNPKYGYLLHKKPQCEACGFIAADKCQLDVVYRDGNKKNKDKSNIKTLCANCNRLMNKKLKTKSIMDITIDSDVRI
jgi:hypothetical protein